jgi:hypothetical protein
MPSVPLRTRSTRAPTVNTPVSKETTTCGRAAHTKHCGLGGCRATLDNTRSRPSAARATKTLRQASVMGLRCANTLMASRTIRPATIAFVDAIAGIMLPAMAKMLSRKKKARLRKPHKKCPPTTTQTFHVKTALQRNAKRKCAQIGSTRNKIHGSGIVLVPRKRPIPRQCLAQQAHAAQMSSVSHACGTGKQKKEKKTSE